MRVVPVAGRDGMLLNLSGAHAPYFTRNLLVLEDSAGRIGAGEVDPRLASFPTAVADQHHQRRCVMIGSVQRDHGIGRAGPA